MTIIFLDFDGVLNTEAPGSSEAFVRTPVLWSILQEKPDVSVVFSTTWREAFTIEELTDKVTKGGGEHLRDRFIGATPMLERPDPRGGQRYRTRELECRAWLRGNGMTRTNWLAIDDVHGWFEFGCQHAYFVRPENGLREQDVPAILRQLAETQPDLAA